MVLQQANRGCRVALLHAYTLIRSFMNRVEATAVDDIVSVFFSVEGDIISTRIAMIPCLLRCVDVFGNNIAPSQGREGA